MYKVPNSTVFILFTKRKQLHLLHYTEKFHTTTTTINEININESKKLDLNLSEILSLTTRKTFETEQPTASISVILIA